FRRWFFFFFQAEDGIRDFHVTGVQTCALPIWFHRTYCELGVDVIETNTFGAFAVPLNEYGIGHRDREISRANAEIARRVADEFGTWVAGSVGPGTKFASLGQISYTDLRDAYHRQALGLLEGGLALCVSETQYDLLGCKAAMAGCRAAMAELGRELPLQLQVTIELTGRMLPGTEIQAALAALEPLRPDVIG